MNLKEKFKKAKGITLIALVVTIIVLLLLAGISITMLTGQNGILNRATQAKAETTRSQAEEKVKLATLYPNNAFDRFDSQMGKSKETFVISPEEAQQKLKSFYSSEEFLANEFNLWFSTTESCFRFFYHGAAKVPPQEMFSFLDAQCASEVPAIASFCKKKKEK